jgi:hypothetical protein
MSTSLQNGVESIPTLASSTNYALRSLELSFLIGLGLFVVSLPFCRSKKSSWDVICARRVLFLLRLFCFAEVGCLAVLLYMYCANSSPIHLHAALKYNNNDSWVYGFGRPVAGILFIAFGFFAEIHPIPRLLCTIGTMGQVMGDSLSAFQIHGYISQVQNKGAPNNGYSISELQIYLWRDIISVGLCTVTFAYAMYLSVMLGFCLPQLIHPSLLSGSFYDRFDVMHVGRMKRKYMEQAGTIDTPPPPLVPRKSLRELVENEFNHITNVSAEVGGDETLYETGLDHTLDEDIIIQYKKGDLLDLALMK